MEGELVINYLEIENFKSYYGKNILGPFHSSFNAVIGPNGSGKSNVIDSLLFVFGFRAQKIRTKKISVLIHNSDQHPNVNSCYVKIFFRKIKENALGVSEVVPNSDFTVKRTAYKDNSSDYHINDRKVQYKEVGQLLRDCGVDLDHNRFLILQGEVEQISLLKPKAANEHEEGLLEYLEDIIGTIRFKPMLESVAIEIDKINEIRTEKANRVQNLQKDKTSLERPKNEALDYLKKENELIETKNFYYQVKAFEADQLVQKRKEDLDTHQEELNEILKNLAEFLKENEALLSDNSEKKKVHEKSLKACEKFKSKLEEFEKEEVQIKEGIKHAKEHIKKLEKSIAAETEKMENFAELPEKNAKKIEELQDDLECLVAKLESADKVLKKKMDQVNEETVKLQDMKKPVEEKLNKLESGVNEAKSHMDVAQSELDVLMNNQNYENDKLEKTKEKIESLEKTLEEKEKNTSELDKTVIPNLDRDYKSASAELTEVSSKYKQLSEVVSKTRNKFSEAQSSMSSNRTRNRVLSFIMQLKTEGKLPGVYGRLGDLGAIDERYDVAVSTACGALDCIIVDTVDTAQACIEALKKNSVGSGTFVALEKQEKWREPYMRKQSYPDNVPRLVDLIKVNDENLMLAFYYSLRNTLVATDLNQATKIAYGGQQRHRVVTLKGEVIEVQGTMSGGGNPMKGRMGTKVQVEEISPETIKNMQQTLAENEQSLKECQRRKYELEPLTEDLNRKLENAKETVRGSTFALKSLNEQITSARNSEKEILKRIKEIIPDEAAQEMAQKNIDKFRTEYEKADAKASKTREENEELTKKIVNISKGILDGPKENLKNLQNEKISTDKIILAANVEIKTAARNLANSEKKLNTAKSDLTENEQNLEGFDKRLNVICKEAEEGREKMELLQVECENLGREITDKSKSKKNLDAQTQKLENNKIDCTHKLEKLRENLQSHEGENKHYIRLKSQLKLHDVVSLENGCFVDNEENPSFSNDKNKEGEELKKYEEDDLDDADKDQLKNAIKGLEEDLATRAPNLNAIESYNTLQKKFMERVSELEEITNQRDQLCSNHDELRKQRLDEFMGGFTKIRLKLKEIYRTVTLDGDAELELVDSLDPFTEGIVLSVRPPKKSWKNVGNLSGGEKTLSSLSLVFALHEFRSTPIYVMDEIDAALDFKNVSIIAHYIKERTKNAQFIIISLRNNMFELCDRLFGIYKVKNCTSATFISPNEMEFDEKKKSNNNKIGQSSTVTKNALNPPAAEDRTLQSTTHNIVPATTQQNILSTDNLKTNVISDASSENIQPVLSQLEMA